MKLPRHIRLLPGIQPYTRTYKHQTTAREKAEDSIVAQLSAHYIGNYSGAPLLSCHPCLDDTASRESPLLL